MIFITEKGGALSTGPGLHGPGKTFRRGTEATIVLGVKQSALREKMSGQIHQILSVLQ